jgi:hypothetical protein
VALSPEEETRIEALTVAMALAPGVYARNRMFDMFATAGVQRAKSRAATLRGIVKHLGRAASLTLAHEGVSLVMRYEIPAMHLSRVVELSRVELATLRILASRAGVPSLPLADDDRALVDATLARLLVAGADTSTLARAAHGSVAPPSSAPPPPGE